ncbi:MAG: hypothetical protein H6573_19860 [Lewinellaceae bacterium]|nr:hypothetical protein [Lewinellaceae bacterium]
MKKYLSTAVLSLLFSFAFSQPLDMSLLDGMKARSIGPAGMSGRVTAVDVNLQNPDEIYVGTASGGLWKSEGGGVGWTPIFDTVGVASIGAIAIGQRNPDVIWVGTGEGNPRNSQSAGGGVYKSIDGGRTWQYMGLRETRNIHRIIIHRDNPDVIYVGALGNAWADSEFRGVYRTVDGGKNWEKILYLNDRTGAADFDVDPANPDKLFVNMWRFRRWPWTFQSGGEGSGLYMTLDGGDSWKRLDEENGLPKGPIGKVGIAIATNNPDVVYALVESEKTALYRSDDGGYNWKKTADKNIGDRPFYYADITVDPENENRLYNVYSNISVSEDGGKTFTTLLGWDNIHGDHHYWWIHPTDGSYMIDGNDGGMAITRDRGKSWRFIENLPVAQFYHITLDGHIPYNVLGGMQDNGTWRGPAYTWSTGGIRNAMWEEIGFGDGFDVVVEKDNSRYAYVMWQGGNLQRIDFETGAQQWVKPNHPEGIPLRFNWNAGIAQDPFDPTVIYYGSQFLHRSADRGRTWETISPDLTTNDPNKQQQAQSGGLTYDVTGAENHCTILSIAPSSLEKGLIWVGTDDGRLQLTRDGGKSWADVYPNIPGVPDSCWIPQVHASSFRAGEAYVVINNYRRGDWKPYLFRTENYGVTWKQLTFEGDVDGYCLSWVQDPVEPKLQFLGTEFGLYVSMDEGQHWTKWAPGYPTVSTIDMKIHPREQDLVIGTFGRAAYVLDDIRPLRTLAAEGAAVLGQPLKVYPAPDAYLAHYKQGAGTRFTGDAYYKGENRPYGALITFSIKEVLKKEEDGSLAQSDTVKVMVYDQQGQRLRQMRAAARKGMNRFSWNLNRDGVRGPSTPKPKDKDALPPDGRPVAPGLYTIVVEYGEHKDSTQVTVHSDPRMEVELDKVNAFYAAWDEWNGSIATATAAMDNLRDAEGRLGPLADMVKDQVQDTARVAAFERTIKELRARIDSLQFIVLPGEDIQGIYRNPEQLQMKISRAEVYFSPSYDAPNPAFHAPTPTAMAVVEEVKRDIVGFVEKVNAFFETDWKAFEEKVDEMELDLIKPIPAVLLK